MSIIRASRLPFLILVSALALAGCMQTMSPVAASDPGSELDAMAYGAPSDPSKPATRAAARREATPAPSAAVRNAMAETPPSAPRAAESFENSGGLLAVLGFDARYAAPTSAPTAAAPQLEAQARLTPPPVAALPPVIVRAPIAPATAEVAPVIAAVAVSHGAEYRLGAGDKLRVMVFGQEGLTNTYAIDAGGAITMPLIGRVSARGQTPAGLAADITARLRSGFIREPSVAVEIESYRPFFILGEVAAPGQYPYVPNMSVEAAIAIAGGFSPRARRDLVTITHPAQGGLLRADVPLGTPLNPGDTVMVSERWF